MAERREFIGTYECMGGKTYSIDIQWALLGEAEEVVRCRDCACSYTARIGGEERLFCCERRGYCREDGYCAWGVRR